MVHRFLRRIAGRARDVVSTMSAEMVSVISVAVIFPLTTRGLGVESYGQYTVLYLIFGLAGVWVFASLSAATIQIILQLERDSDEVLRLGRRQVLVAASPVAVLGTALTVALYGPDLLLAAVLVLAIDLVLTSLASLNLAALYALDGVVRAAKLRMIQPIARAGGVLALAIGGLVTINTLVAVNIAASGLLLVCTDRALRRVPARGADHQPTAGELIRYSGYYAMSMSTNAAQDEGEKFVLATSRSATEVGQYAAAYRVVSMTLIPLRAVTAAAGRWFMVRDERTGAQLTRTARLSVAASIYGLLAGVAIFLGRDLVQRVAGSEFDDIALISAWLCLLPLLHGLGELPPMALLGLGRNRERMFMGFGTAALAIISYLILVPSIGWRGAVLGTYISEIAGIVVGWLLLVRYQRIADRRTLGEQPAGAPLPAAVARP
jgi:O-antigen/teichoic acid export membrane protein